ncbi:hypothetical protein BURK1_02259 [Burkholderiales bacterium]|nr:hypothetical protein BURK1_02259 [Burkholderiales bacterium]
MGGAPARAPLIGAEPGGNTLIRLAAFAVAAAASTPAWALMNNAFLFVAVPTLDEVGLGLLIALVAGVAGWAVRRRSGRR